MWEKTYGLRLPKNSKEHQEQLIHQLSEMVIQGYLHQDCHVGNIGFIDDMVVLFDFGFTIPMQASGIVLEAMLISQLYIVIEKCGYDAKYADSNLLNQRIDNFWTQFATDVSMVEPLDSSNVTIHEQDIMVTSFIDWTLRHYPEESATVQKNIVLCFLYKYIDFLAKNYYEVTKKAKKTRKMTVAYYRKDYTDTTEFPSKAYDIIYKIRQNVFANLEELRGSTSGGRRINRRTRSVSRGAKRSTRKRGKHRSAKVLGI